MYFVASLLARTRRLLALGCILLACLTSATTNVALAGAEVRYALPHGKSSFIIRVAPPSGHRSVSFVNENLAAEGNLAIAVADRELAAGSPLWSDVQGTIAFRHKRLFTLSLVGIEANYVRLTFEVDAPERIATR